MMVTSQKGPERLQETRATRAPATSGGSARTVVAAADPEKVFSEARKHFGRWRRANDPVRANPIPAPPPLDSTYAFVFTHEVQTVTVQLSWRGPSLARDSSDTRDASTLADLLNADESPFQRLLVDAGPFRSARMSADINRHGSELRFTAITAVSQIANALGGLGTVLDQLVSSEFFDESALIADAKRDRVARALAFEETPSLAASPGSAWAVGRLACMSRDTTTAAAPSGTRRSIAAFAGRWIAKRPYVVGALTPVGTETKVGTAIAQYIAFMKQ